MAKIFNYQKFETHLIKETRTLEIKFKTKEGPTFFDLEFLFELESILAWATTRLEIHTIYIESSASLLSKGINTEILKSYPKTKIEKIQQKLQKINQSLMLLPQTVIINIGEGTKNIASEFALAADIRIGQHNAKVSFDHANLGLIPCSGGIAQLGQMIGHGNARAWILSGQEIEVEPLLRSGFLLKTYENKKDLELLKYRLLKSITNQAPVARVQTKLGITEAFREQVDTLHDFEKKISKAAMISEDWKADDPATNFPLKHMKTAIKLSLIKSDESPSN